MSWEIEIGLILMKFETCELFVFLYGELKQNYEFLNEFALENSNL